MIARQYYSPNLDDFRLYEPKDYEEIKSLLMSEGIPEDEIAFDTFLTIAIEGKNGELKGFYSLKRDYNIPHLQHLYIKKEYRTPDLARKTIMNIMLSVKRMGFDRFIMHADKPYIAKLIEYYFKGIKPYAIKDGEKWYVMGV